MDCAVRLKAFYETVEKAPKALNRVSKELKTFALLLRQIDDTRARHGVEDSEVLQECIEICVESTQEIVGFTLRLEEIMKRHTFAGRIYSALRMQDVQDICAELERAKNSLMMAFQVFDHRTQVQMMHAAHSLAVQQSLLLLKHGESIAQIREDTAMLMSRSVGDRQRRCLTSPRDERSNNTPASTAMEDKRTCMRASDKPVSKAGQKRKHLRFRLPLWFSNKVWEISLIQSLGRCGFCIQTYYQWPEYVPVVAYYLAGRVDLVQQMFRDGQASPYDIYGKKTPLEVRKHPPWTN